MADDRMWDCLVSEGDAVKRQLLDRAGGVLAAQEVADRLGIDGGVVHDWTMMGKVIAVPVRNGYFYPSCQFEGKATIPGLMDALEAMPIKAPWMRLEWLLTPDDALGGLSPLDALKAGERDKVVGLAGSHGAD